MQANGIHSAEDFTDNIIYSVLLCGSGFVLLLKESLRAIQGALNS